VTTEPANVGGREIYGYPKFVTEIPFKLEDGAFSAAVLDRAGASRSDVQRPTGHWRSVTPLSLVLYSVLNGARLRTGSTCAAGPGCAAGQLQLAWTARTMRWPATCASSACTTGSRSW
jgi:hypothetical protein